MTSDREVSRAMLMALRHQPDAFGLTLDNAGWVDTALLVDALIRHGLTEVDEDRIRRVIERSAKKRHVVQDGRVRAAYGHSIHVDVELHSQEPPEILLHGTSPSDCGNIFREGLRPMRRQHVHLSDDLATAQSVGARHAKNPVVLKVRAHDAWVDGVRFERREAHVWVSDPIPPAYLEGSDVSAERAGD